MITLPVKTSLLRGDFWMEGIIHFGFVNGNREFCAE